MLKRSQSIQPPMVGMPPRAVPCSVRARLLFGGFANQFGWFFIGFGMVFVWVFGAVAGLSTLFAFRGELATARGTVTQREKTHFSEGGDDSHDGTPVYAMHYTFADADGNSHSGVSYKTGGGPSEGTTVTVEYPAGDPETSRIRGLRASPFGPWIAFVLVFPITGLFFVVGGLRRGLKGQRLLKHGQVALGTLQHKRPTNTRINNRRVYKLTFSFTADDGQPYEAVAKTHMPEKLEDEAQELLMYDPVDPRRAVLLDDLPGSPRFDETGQVQAGRAATSLAILLIPLATIVGHGTYAYLHFGR